ncbi:hypothetical protein Scep_021426 [Stephania cephalantha]|uniref:Uncharacterized protein n=1 Tax=Stephania cephalantha TaxID=152367 RepID=A0AAP0F8Y7_9MAGN
MKPVAAARMPAVASAVVEDGKGNLEQIDIPGCSGFNHCCCYCCDNAFCIIVCYPF